MGFVPCGAPLTLAFLPTQINIYFSASWIKWRCSAICSPPSITCSALLCQHVALSLEGLRGSHHSSINTRCWDTIWAGSAPSAQHHLEERTEKLSTRHSYSYQHQMKQQRLYKPAVPARCKRRFGKCEPSLLLPTVMLAFSRELPPGTKVSVDKEATPTRRKESLPQNAAASEAELRFPSVQARL